MSDSCKWCGRNLDFVSNKPLEQRKIGDTEECEACIAVPCVSIPSKNRFSCSVCKKNFLGPYAIVPSGPCCDGCLFKDKQETPENRLETPTSAVYKRFLKRLLAYEPSRHDLLVLLFRIATNEGGYTESDLVYMIDKIFSDRDVDADLFEGEIQEEQEAK